MLRRLLITTAAAALVVGSAVAQQQPSTSPPPNLPQKSEPMPKAEPMAKGSAQFITQQSAGQLLWSRFRGTDVIGNNNEKVGDVNDVLFDQNGRVLAYVIGVGGFLGIGSKDVALAPSAFQVQPATDREDLKLRLTMTRDELKNAPEFKALPRSQQPTTGQAPPRDRVPATPPERAPVSPPASPPASNR
jgi:hypothetical protein